MQQAYAQPQRRRKFVMKGGKGRVQYMVYSSLQTVKCHCADLGLSTVRYDSWISLRLQAACSAALHTAVNHLILVHSRKEVAWECRMPFAFAIIHQHTCMLDMLSCPMSYSQAIDRKVAACCMLAIRHAPLCCAHAASAGEFPPFVTSFLLLHPSMLCMS